MKRFNETTTGYRFDKFIFWGAILVILLVLGTQFLKYGTTFKPYINCKGPDDCENPFYSTDNYKCTLAFGFAKCEIDYYEWLEVEELPPGEYGERPANNTGFFLIMGSMLLLAFCLNHFYWNKGKKFHINFMNTLNKIEVDNEKD